jgi:uncharacterized membrane protein
MEKTIDAGRRSGRLPRLAAVDAARGTAIAGVVVYHFIWDLAFLRLTGPGLASHPLWIAFGRTLAGSFLFLAGLSLVLANGKRLSLEKYSKRMLKIVVAALAITAVTWLAFPESFVYFGILHAIVFGSAVALTAAAGVAFITMPRFFSSALFDPRWLAWIGFSENTPLSNDFVPVFPWFGVFLFGMATAQAVDLEWLARRLGTLPRSLVVVSLSWLGRRSLAIYLVHQPVLLAVLYPLS